MGHEAGYLIFWKPRVAEIGDPARVLRSLEKGRLPKVLSDIDVDAGLSALKRTYRSFKGRSPVELDFPRQETAITIGWSRRHFAFYFEGNAFKQMDRVSLLMSKLGLACYDARANALYPPEAPPRFVGSREEEAWWEMVERVTEEWRDRLLDEFGFARDAKTKASSSTREMLRIDRERTMKFLERQSALTSSPEFFEEVDRRLAGRVARKGKKRARKRAKLD